MGEPNRRLVSRDLFFRFLRSMREEYGRRPATILFYRKNYGYFLGWLRGQGIKAEKARVTRKIIKRWLASMRVAGLSEETIRGRLGALSSFFSYLHAEGILKVNPCRGLPRPRLGEWQPRGALSETEAARVWRTVCSNRPLSVRQARVALLLMWQAGGRAGEVLGADWEHVAWERRAWWIANGKGGRSRWVPLSALALEHLRELWELRRCPATGPIFLAHGSRRRLSYQALWKQVKGWCRRAGIPKASPHWFRHTYVTRLAELATSPMDLRKIQLLAGHANLNTTAGYLHTPEADRGLVDQAFRIGT